ncbi:MAG: hypothetical protein K0R92_1623 [Lachnospiraceae bacterium]|jgi:hypothetical protein|nr:hypothetical protein [Lachnospiraceae bacterium]
MTDIRWPASQGWIKMSKNVNGVEMHSQAIIRMTKTIAIMRIAEIMEIVMETTEMVIPVIITTKRITLIGMKLPKHLYLLL